MGEMMKIIALVLSLMIWSVAFADEPVRDFSSDMPGKADSAITVAKGYFQFETDFLNYTDSDNILETFDPAIKYGISNTTDIEILLGGFLTDTKTHESSFGDVTVRLKYNIVGDDPSPTDHWTIALIPYLKLPTAREPFGNDAFEGGVLIPIQYSLPFDPDTNITFEQGIADLRNTSNTGQEISLTEIFDVSRKIYKNLSGTVEIYSQYYGNDKPVTTFDMSFSDLITKTMQVDVGMSIGLNHAADGINVYTGISFRF